MERNMKIHTPFLVFGYRLVNLQGGIFAFRRKEIITMSDERLEKQKVKEITDKLEEGLKELFESEKYKSYLSTMSKFHNYSFNNTLLIAMQKPEATLVAGYKAW